MFPLYCGYGLAVSSKVSERHKVISRIGMIFAIG